VGENDGRSWMQISRLGARKKIIFIQIEILSVPIKINIVYTQLATTTLERKILQRMES
jgi:hypothetical protein